MNRDDDKVVICETLGGNWFGVAGYLNKHNLAKYLVSVSPVVGHYCQIMLVMPKSKAIELDTAKIIRYKAC